MTTQPTTAEATQTTPTAEATLPIPAGWEAFAELEYSGIAREGWVYQTLDSSMFAGDQAAILPGLPEATRQFVIPNLDAQNLDNVLYVYVDPENELLASNITLLTCGEAAGIVLDANTWLEIYANSEIDAEVMTVITVLGDETTVFRINASPAVATYQVPFRAGGACESIATLVSLPGEDDRIDDFVTFMEHLRLTN